MKKYIIIGLCLVLTACLFTGCRGRQNNSATSAPTIMPTVELPTQASTETPTAGPTEASTVPTVTSEPNGTSDPTDATHSTGNTDMGRSRSGRRIPGGY